MLRKVLTPKHFLLLALLTISLTQATGNWLTCYSQPNGAVLPVEDDCHVYIYCLDQTPFTIACPFGMGFSASQGHCVDLGKSDCATDRITPTSTSGRVQARGTCDNEIREANKQACKGQPFGELVPYPGDCSKFLVCNCEYPTVKQCQGGTWFDNTIKTCNYPQNVDCKDGNGSGETTTPITTSSTTTTTLAPTTTITTTSTTTSSTESTPEWGENCEAPPGMSEDICLKYNNGFLLRYPYNCNAYINCTLGCPIMNYCPADKVFNAFLKICDTPDTAQCVELPLPPSTTTITSSSSTEETSTTSTTTEEITSSSTTTEESSSSSTTTEEPTSSSTTTEEPSTTSTSSSSTEISSTTESGSEWGKDCIAPPGMSEDICLKYNNGLLLRYPYDCNAYINCTMGCPVMDYCPPDKVFNDLLKICDTPDTAHCIELPMPPTTTTEATTSSTTEEPTTSSTTEEPTTSSTTEEPTTSSTTEETSSTTEETTTELTTSSTTEQPDICIPPLGVEDDICSSESQIVFQPYPYNCTAYILCKGTQPCLKYCEPGKIFNTLLGICDDDMECEEIPLPTTTTTEATTTTTEEPTTTTTKPLPPNVNPNMCEGKEDYTIYPYESDCKEYLLCSNGEVKLESCPEGWLFNAKLMLCDKASEEVCYTGPTTTTEEPTTSTTLGTTIDPGLEVCKGQPLGKTFPYKDNCQLYYYCKGNGEYFLISCPRNNYYDPYSGDCGPNVSPTACQEPLTTTLAPTTPATTLSPSEMCSQQPGGITYPYVEDCSKYIYCMGNGGYLIMNCPYNNYYYPDTGDCGPSDDINICRKPSTTPTTTTAATTTEVIVTTPPEVVGICGNYTNGQLIPYPDNCQKYISCVKPIPIGFYCNNDWYFDVNQQKCIPDEQGLCGGAELPGNETTTVATPSDICQGLKEGDWQIYPTNCQFYYECLGDGYYMLKICTEGEYFDPLLGECSAQVGADYCKQNFNTTLPPETTTPLPTPTPKPKPQGICLGKEKGDIIPYPQNCSKYIICENPIPVGYNCAKGLEFSTEAQKCVQPYESDCGLLTTTTTTLEPTTKPYNQCTNKPDFTLLPYEQDCAMFIICLEDKEHWAYCPQGEYFDLEEMLCTKEANEDSCLSLKSTTSTTTTTEAITTTTQDPNLGPCYNKPDGTKIPYPNNCTKYIVCQDPLNVGYDCPEGLEFSIYYDECVVPELADCSIKTTTTTTTTTEKTTTPLTPETCENKPTGATLPYTEDCSKYYVCINGKELLANCMPNSYYDPLTGDCDPDISPLACQGSITTTTTLKPTINPGPCNQEDNGYIYTNEENCSQYYMCLNDTTILCQCQNQTYYNPYTKECDPETSNNECKEPLTSTTLKPTTSTKTTEETSTKTTEPTTTTQTTNNSTKETTTPTTTTNSVSSSTTLEPTTTTTTPEHSQDNICCGQKSGTYLSYPGDNSKYVICLYPVPEVHSCVEGGIYDPESFQCKLVTPYSLRKPDCTQSKYGETMVYNGDCTKYYFCYGSEAVILDCSFNWNYDPTIEQCVPKNQYKCPW